MSREDIVQGVGGATRAAALLQPAGVLPERGSYAELHRQRSGHPH